MAVDEFYVPDLNLMVLETPLLRVSRPVAACSRCRSAKIKCDGKLPSCTACDRAGKQAECSSTNDQFARGKERSYVSTLETRVEKLERRIREAQQRKSSVVSMPDQDTPPNEPHSRHVSTVPTPPLYGKAAKRRERLEIDDLVSDFGYLTVSATARDFYGFTTTMSYARLILAACSKDPLPTNLMSVPLPPRHSATIIIQHYFDNFFILYPLFQESSFFASLDAVYNAGGALATAFDHFCVRMVLAIAHAGKLEQRGDPHYTDAVGHVTAALSYAEQILRPGSIQSVQALLLLHEYAMIDPHHFDTWSIIGAASRAMVDLGLHQDPSKGTPMSKAKLELRRRVFYCVYAFDRSTSLIQTRAFSFSDDSTNVRVPFASSQLARLHAHAPSNHTLLKTFDSALDLFKLRKLQSAWYTELFQSGREPWTDPYPALWRICQSMKEWFDGLSNNTTKHIRSFFELNLLYSYVYILAPSPRVPAIVPFAQNLIYEYCIQYADAVGKHVDNRVHTAPISFYDAMRVYMTGRQFIDVLQGNLDRLLSGITPELPHVPVDSAPPPAMPNTPKDAYTNASRSINCINQLTDTLGLFGMRWGYMSWRDRFQKDSEETMNALHRRLWELQDASSNMSGQSTRPNWQHANSTGSLSEQLGTPSPYARSSMYSSPPSGLQPVLTPTYPPDFYTQRPGYFSHQSRPSQTSPQNSFDQQRQQPMNATLPPQQQFATWHGLSNAAHADAQPEEAVPPASRHDSYGAN